MKKLVLLFCLFSLPVFAGSQHLTILHFNDLHGHVEQAAKIATVIKEIRRKNDKKGWQTLVLNGGDLISGTPASPKYEGKAETDFINATGVDISTIGNHDFDFGYGNLEKMISASKSSFLAATIADKKTGKLITSPYVIKNQPTGLKILIIGLAMKDLPRVALPKNVEAFSFKDPITVAKKIMAKEGAKTDIQIAITHEGMANDIKLAKAVEAIDTVIGGHDHVGPKDYCRTVGKIPVCQTPANGAYLGRIDLEIERRQTHVRAPQPNGPTMGWVDLEVDSGVVDVKEVDHKLIPIDSKIKDDVVVARLMDGYLDPIRAEMSEVLGYAIHEYKHSREFKSPGSPLGVLIAKVMKDYGGADIGVINAGGVRRGLPKGKITRGVIEEMLPFPNIVVVLKLRGSDIKKLLQTTTRTTLQYYGFNNIDDLDPKKEYRLATISYLASGGDNCKILKNATLVKDTKTVIKDAFIDYVKKEKKI